MIQVRKEKNNTSTSSILILKPQSPRSLFSIIEKKISREIKEKKIPGYLFWLMSGILICILQRNRTNKNCENSGWQVPESAVGKLKMFSSNLRIGKPDVSDKDSFLLEGRLAL